jgi:polyisoprenoid-binding protein YceI
MPGAFLLLAAMAAVAASPASAATWQMLPAQSSIGFAADWNGATVQGRFQRFATAIDFDPAQPAAAKITAVIDLASASSADTTVNGALPGDDWFAVKKLRQARFVAGSVQMLRPGAYLARGTLTLRGVSVPVDLPFTLAIAGDTATMAGTVKLDRRAFRIGMESDAAGTWVAFAVPVSIRIVARRNR